MDATARFLKLAGNLREYMEAELHFIDTEYDFPVAKLKDIHIYFNHSKNQEEAENNWNRRKARINYDNLFLLMYDREELTNDEILQLSRIPCQGYIVLSDKGRESIDFVKTIKPSPSPTGQQFLDRKWYGLHTFETQFDYVKWLNQQ